MKRVIYSCVLVAVFFMLACFAVKAIAQQGANGVAQPQQGPKTVTLYEGGKELKTWQVKDDTVWRDRNDGAISFYDAANGRLVRIFGNGTVVVE